MNIETREHLFWECQKVQPLWNALNEFITSRSINITITKEFAFFGIHTKFKYTTICNFLIILMKFYIFSMKYRNVMPSFNSYLQYLKLRQKIEAQAALEKDKYESHTIKWNVLKI